MSVFEVHKTADEPVVRCGSFDSAQSMAYLEFARVYERESKFSPERGGMVSRSRIVLDCSDDDAIVPTEWSDWE